MEMSAEFIIQDRWAEEIFSDLEETTVAVTYIKIYKKQLTTIFTFVTK